MSEHPIDGLLNTSLSNLRQLVDVNTIIGDPIQVGDTTIIPVSKVSFGFASGGSDFATSKKPTDLFGGGSGGGVTISPIAFLVVSGGEVHLLPLAANDDAAGKVANLIPEVIDKIGGIVSKKKKDAAEKDGACPKE